jgi:tetratricopeptide (TPR) repeat protein
MRALRLDRTRPKRRHGPEFFHSSWSLNGMKTGWVASWSALSRSRAFQRACAAGDRARDRRDWASAASHYRKALDKNSKAAHIAVQLGHAYKELGDYETAASQYYGALRDLSTDDDIHLQIGHIEKLRGNHNISFAHYKLAAELNPNNKDALLEVEVASARFDKTPALIESEIATSERSIGSQNVGHSVSEEDPEIATRELPHQEPATAGHLTNASSSREATPPHDGYPSSTLVARPTWAPGATLQPNDFILRSRAIEDQLLEHLPKP